MGILAVLYIAFLITTSIASCALVALAWERRNLQGAKWLIAMCVLLFILCVSSSLEAYPTTLAGKEFWVNIQYIGYMGLSITYLSLMLIFSGLDRYLTARSVWLLCAIPVIILAFAFTNASHHLMRSDLHVVIVDGLPVLGKTFGPVNWLAVAFCYTCAALCIAVLCWTFWRRPPLRGQTVMLFLGLMLPTTWNSLYLTPQAHTPYLDFFPPLSGITVMIITYCVMRLHTFALLPIARHRIIESVQEGILVVDTCLRIVDMNPAMERALGQSSLHLLGRSAAAVLPFWPLISPALTAGDQHGDDVMLEYMLLDAIYELRISPVLDHQQQIMGWLILLYDVTARKQAEQMTQYMAYHDSLTDLPNRAYYLRHLSEKLARSRRSGKRFAVYALDLDGFKAINDTLGHRIGDAVLQHIAHRLRETVREGELVTRFGGDEFYLLQYDVDDRSTVASLAARIIAAIDQPVLCDGHACHVTASIGISLFPDDGETGDALLHHADMAMYTAKGRGKNQYAFYTDSVPAPVG